MTNTIRLVFGALAVALVAIIMVPLFASAQTPTARLVIVTQTTALSPVPTQSILVNVTGTGPSLNSTPTAIGTLTYASSFNNDTRVITMVPGSYTVTIPSTSGYSYSYDSNCSGSLVAGETRTCTVVASAGGTSYVNVSVNVQNRYGGTRTPSDFVISVSGTNTSISSLPGSVGSTQISMGPGAFSINLSTASGYAVTRSEGCSGSIVVGETKSCVITVSDTSNYYNNGNYTNPANQLLCTPSTQTVYRGDVVSFNAQGGNSNYTWATADRTYLNVGPSLNVRLLSSGDQAVYVTSGYQTATCTVRVLPSTYQSGGVVLGDSTKAPGLPNTGFAPMSLSMTLLTLFASIIAIGFAFLALYPYARRTVSSFSK